MRDRPETPPGLIHAVEDALAALRIEQARMIGRRMDPFATWQKYDEHAAKFIARYLGERFFIEWLQER
jgi:hypothetical protein